MSTDKHLDKLFEQARNATPLMNADDIEMQLKVKGNHTPKFKFFNLKIVSIMSTLLVLVGGLFFWLPQSNSLSNEPTQVNKLVQTQNNEKTLLSATKNNETNLLIAKTSVANNGLIKPATKQLVTQKPAYSFQLFLPQNLTHAPSQNNMPLASMPQVILSPDEMNALHIYKDGSNLNYLNIANGGDFDAVKYRDIPNYFYINYNSKSYTTYSGNQNILADNNNALLKVRPSLIQMLTENFVDAKKEETKETETANYICSPAGFLCNENDYVALIKSNFIPIKINVQSYKTATVDFVFWYEPTQDFINALSKENALSLALVVENYNAIAFNEKLNLLVNTKKSFIAKLDENFANAIKSTHNKLVLSNQNLAKLGFMVDGKTLFYENKYAAKKYLGIYIKNGQGHSYYYWDKVSFFKKRHFTKLPFYPLFSTSSAVAGAHLIPNDYEIPLDLQGYQPNEQAQILFNRMKQNLIPVEISLPNALTGSIIEQYWFEPTPEFNAVIAQIKASETAKNEVKRQPKDRSISLNNIKLIELNAAELEKLGITVKDKGIKVTTNNKLGDKPSTAIYSKSGSIFEMVLKKTAPEVNGKSENNAVGSKVNDSKSIDTTLQIKMIPSDMVVNISVNAGPDQAISFIKNSNAKNTYPDFSLITDDLGQLWRAYVVEDGLTEEDRAYMRKNRINPDRYEKAKKGKEAGERNLIASISGYVPILVKSGDVNLPDDKEKQLWRADIIIWFEPKEKLFNALPERIANDLRAEYQSVFVNKTSASGSCKYFETCKNNPGAIDAYQVFPNPSDDAMDIQFTLNADRLVSANIYTIGGQLVKSVFDEQAFPKGQNTYNTHINELAQGIYLLVIDTDKGERITQRILRK